MYKDKNTDIVARYCAHFKYEDIPEEKVRFIFDRNEHHGSAIKYLYKVCSSQRKCQDAKSMGDKIEALVGCIISLSESFIEKPFQA